MSRQLRGSDGAYRGAASRRRGGCREAPWRKMSAAMLPARCLSARHLAPARHEITSGNAPAGPAASTCALHYRMTRRAGPASQKKTPKEEIQSSRSRRARTIRGQRRPAATSRHHNSSSAALSGEAIINLLRFNLARQSASSRTYNRG